MGGALPGLGSEPCLSLDPLGGTWLRPLLPPGRLLLLPSQVLSLLIPEHRTAPMLTRRSPDQEVGTRSRLWQEPAVSATSPCKAVLCELAMTLGKGGVR